MRNRHIASVLFLIALSICASPHCFAQKFQQKPLTRTFTADAEERYQVTATIRVETHGITTEKIGEKTYATPFTHQAEGLVSWRATRKISADQRRWHGRNRRIPRSIPLKLQCNIPTQ